MRSAMLLKNISRRYDRHSCTSAIARWLSFVAANIEAEILTREYEERQRVLNVEEGNRWLSLHSRLRVVIHLHTLTSNVYHPAGP